eukprot:1937716-Pyramimonas_sp.AAC.1
MSALFLPQVNQTDFKAIRFNATGCVFFACRFRGIHSMNATQLRPEMRSSIPDAVHSKDWERCRGYIWSWIWKMRRVGKDSVANWHASFK